MGFAYAELSGVLLPADPVLCIINYVLPSAARVVFVFIIWRKDDYFKRK